MTGWAGWDKREGTERHEEEKKEFEWPIDKDTE